MILNVFIYIKKFQILFGMSFQIDSLSMYNIGIFLQRYSIIYDE